MWGEAEAENGEPGGEQMVSPEEAVLDVEWETVLGCGTHSSLPRSDLAALCDPDSAGGLSWAHSRVVS